jgi:hypothetical protein
LTVARKQRDPSRSRGFPWRQALIAAGLCAVLIAGFGWFDASALGIDSSIKPWWLLAVAILSGAAGFTLVVGEWLLRGLFRRVGIASTIDVELRSRF